MGWIVAGVETRVTYKNTKLSRNGMLSLISHRDRNVELLVPPGPYRFKDFVELESWLSTPIGRLSKDVAECMAEADAATDAVEDAPESPETRYFQEVSDTIRMMGDRGDLVFYTQLNLDFMTASMGVYKAGFENNVPARLVGGFIADGADRYRSNPILGVLYLEESRKNIPRLWPEVREPALQNLLAQLTDRKGKA
jgi:hypothetical protein